MPIFTFRLSGRRAINPCSLGPSCLQTLNCRQIKHNRGASGVIFSRDESPTNESKNITNIVISAGHSNLTLHHKGMFAQNTSIFVPSSREGLTSAAPRIHISQFISATIWAGGQGSLCWATGPRPGRSCTWHIHCGHPRYEDKKSHLTLFRKHSTAS